MRGFIYEVSDDVEALGTIEEYSYYDRVSEFGVDCVEEQEGEDKKDALASVLETLKKYGFSVGTENGLDYFIPTREIRQKIAEEAFARFREHAAKLTPDDFATDSWELYRTKQAVEDTAGDLFVIPNGCEYPLMQWLANLTDEDFGKKFYFGSVIGMG